MSKMELIEAFRNKADITKNETTAVVNLFFDKMADTIAAGDRTKIRGLCSLYVKEYPAYTGRNPKTGEKVQVRPKKLPFFKEGRDLKERLDGSVVNSSFEDDWR